MLVTIMLMKVIVIVMDPIFLCCRSNIHVNKFVGQIIILHVITLRVCFEGEI